MTLWYPDVSHYQNFALEKDTVIVCAKATEGVGFTDPSYGRWKKQAQQVGALFWGYHFVHLDVNTVEQEAAYAHSVLGTTPAMLDYEYTKHAASPAQVANLAKQLRKLGTPCYCVYLPKWYWTGNLHSASLSPLIEAGMNLVSSDYKKYSDTGEGWQPYGGMTPQIWQYTDKLQYSTGTCDFNAYKGTLSQFKKMIHGEDVSTVADDVDSRGKTTNKTSEGVWNTPIFPTGNSDHPFEWAITTVQRIEDKLDQVLAKLNAGS